MSKLVKLTSNDSRNKTDNSFKCQCDDDIIIAPNSKVSLINAHISSGILASYKIGSEDTVGNTNGEILGELYLSSDASDRKRQIILDSGDYQISILLSDMTTQFNKSLLYKSTSTALSTSSNTFNTPDDLDFGLGILCDTDDNKKVNIKYNAMPQKTAMSYSNFSNGISIQNGVIKYDLPQNIKTLALDGENADNTNKIVYAKIDDPSDDFNDGSIITLQDMENNTTPLVASIVSSEVSYFNTDYSVSLDPTKASQQNLTVQTTTLNNTKHLHINDLVVLDDGLGVLGTPSANQISATIADVADEQYVNANYEFNNLQSLKASLTLYLQDISVIAPVNKSGFANGDILTVSINPANAVANHLIVGAVFQALDGNKKPTYYTTITAVNPNVQNPSQTDITINVSKIDGGAKTIKFLRTFEYFYTGKKSVNNQQDLELLTTDTLIAYIDGSEILSFTPKSIAYDATNKRVAIEILPNSQKYDTGETFNNDPIQASIRLSAYDKFEITSMSRFKTNNVLQNFGFANNDSLIVIGNTIFDTLVCGTPTQFTDSQNNNYVMCPISSNKYNDPYLDYVNMKNILFELLVNAKTIVKNNTNQYIQYTLSDVSDPTKLGVCTRMWEGTNISAVKEYQLTYNKSRVNLTNYDLMVLGSNIIPQDTAMCIEDSRLNHGCGRVAFLVNQLGNCQMGFMPEGTFNNQTPSNNLYSVNIEGSEDNYYYTIRKGTQLKGLKRKLEAIVGDRIIIQWGVCPSTNDYEYTDNITNATNSDDVRREDTEASTGEINDDDRGKILVSILRQNAQNAYFYLGSVIDATSGVNTQLSKCIPWTPRENPYIEPDYFDNTTNQHIFVCPNLAQISVLELTQDATVVSVNGITKNITPAKDTTTYFDASMHTNDNVELLGLSSRFTAFNNSFNFVFTDLNLQKQLGFKNSKNPLSGNTGVWPADITYLSAYLPENVVILLDNMSNIQTYDLNKNNGGRRNIICVAINTQEKAGEINIEPTNLYKISLQNKDPINLKKFNVSFENFYGEAIQLQSARAVVNLLFEE